jgi:hypothetical protein
MSTERQEQPNVARLFNEQFEQMGFDARAEFMRTHLCNVMRELQGSILEALGIYDFGENPDGSLKEYLKNSYEDWLPPYTRRMRIVVTGVRASQFIFHSFNLYRPTFRPLVS